MCRTSIWSVSCICNPIGFVRIAIWAQQVRNGFIGIDWPHRKCYYCMRVSYSRFTNHADLMFHYNESCQQPALWAEATLDVSRFSEVAGGFVCTPRLVPRVGSIYWQFKIIAVTLGCARQASAILCGCCSSCPLFFLQPKILAKHGNLSAEST